MIPTEVGFFSKCFAIYSLSSKRWDLFQRIRAEHKNFGLPYLEVGRPQNLFLCGTVFFRPKTLQNFVRSFSEKPTVRKCLTKPENLHPRTILVSKWLQKSSQRHQKWDRQLKLWQNLLKAAASKFLPWKFKSRGNGAVGGINDSNDLKVCPVFIITHSFASLKRKSWNGKWGYQWCRFLMKVVEVRIMWVCIAIRTCLFQHLRGTSILRKTTKT